MTGDLFHYLLIAVFVATPLTFLSLMFVAAPYGRHDRGGWGPKLDTKLAWIIMEAPSCVGFALFYFLGENRFELAPLILFFIWQTHYFHRTFIYPLRMRTSPDKKTTGLMVLFGFSFNVINSYLNGTNLTREGSIYGAEWLRDPHFILGVLLFASGYAINKYSDSVLRDLRKPGETGYKIPRGGVYELVSCPNYLGEVLEWVGWAVATWSLAGLSFAVFTAANLLPRAIANHRWYHKKFPDYPKARKAVIPYLV
jgi:protein-S-isoprenylcysteine O-methyltransferase Ste14